MASNANFTDARTDNTIDEVWIVEHNPVFTQGQVKAEHLLDPGEIPIVKSDRGGQVTYHSGQLVAYFLVNLRRKDGVRDLVTHLESLVINTLKSYGIESAAKPMHQGSMFTARKSVLWG